MDAMDTIESIVKEILDQESEFLVAKNISSDKKWTTSIKTSLTKYFYDNDYWVHTEPNDVDTTVNAWLYDFTVYKARDDKGQDIDFIELILESEWKKSFEELKYDFYKLLQGRAAHRIFIFQAINVSETFNRLKSIIEKSNLAIKGDRYFLAGWNNNDGFEFILHIKE